MALVTSRLRPLRQITALVSSCHPLLRPETNRTKRKPGPHDPTSTPAFSTSARRSHPAHEENTGPSPPSRPPRLACPHCTQTFTNTARLSLHVKQVHENPKLLTCPHCLRLFSAEDTKKLNDHIHRKHRFRMLYFEEYKDPSPLDLFFKKHVEPRLWDMPKPGDWVYDWALPPSLSFKRLYFFRRWEPGARKLRLARLFYGKALVGELVDNLGHTDPDGVLADWRKLCRAVGVAEKALPADVDACRELMRGKYVNLLDLAWWLKWKCHEVPGKKVMVFGSVKELQRYSKVAEKGFPEEYLDEQLKRDLWGKLKTGPVVRYLLDIALDIYREYRDSGRQYGLPRVDWQKEEERRKQQKKRQQEEKKIRREEVEDLVRLEAEFVATSAFTNKSVDGVSDMPKDAGAVREGRVVSGRDIDVKLEG
ncbi:uncharacterized protein BKCO1_25000129 [Diplodia corticola]|uniref:C2H2-type domain-containing protein n=1 Tax=Diplodia corticola TaxID=236234 RepID=A0A1J9S0J7_9PEZI|nr:uncharacterized protein BKCO1_25000129 [Diplodia corticola]OJD34103.1 hypothetical protein BKCO1_25000129 [Diplodia corticola]